MLSKKLVENRGTVVTKYRYVCMQAGSEMRLSKISTNACAMPNPAERCRVCLKNAPLWPTYTCRCHVNMPNAMIINEPGFQQIINSDNSQPQMASGFFLLLRNYYVCLSLEFSRSFAYKLTESWPTSQLQKAILTIDTMEAPSCIKKIWIKQQEYRL